MVALSWFKPLKNKSDSWKRNNISDPQKHINRHLYIWKEEWRLVLGGARELIKLATGRENDESNFSFTKDREFICFLEKSISPLSKSDLPINLVFYLLQFHSSPTHFNPLFFLFDFLIWVIVDPLSLLTGQPKLWKKCRRKLQTLAREREKGGVFLIYIQWKSGVSINFTEYLLLPTSIGTGSKVT